MANILLLQGWARDQRHWSTFLQALPTRFPNTHIHCLDAPGTGTESHRMSPLAITEIVEDLRYRWRLQKNGPALLVGLSMGGMFTLEWAMRFPQDLTGAVVINSSISNFST